MHFLEKCEKNCILAKKCEIVVFWNFSEFFEKIEIGKEYIKDCRVGVVIETPFTFNM